MVPPTRTDPLEHVLLNVLEAADADDPYRLALAAAGVNTIDDLLSLSKFDLQELTWGDGQQRLPIGKINLLLSIRTWFQDQATTDDAAFLTLTPTILTEHRRALAAAPPQQPAVPPTSPAAAPVPVTDRLSAADEFKKGIKRDIRAFKPFKDKKHWNPWYRGFTAIAVAQGLGNVLDPDYVPSTPEEQALFDVLQAYTFAVFTSCLVETQAATLVREYSGRLAGANAGNAQKLHAALVKKMSTGIAAMTQRTALETRVMSLRLDNSWNSGIVSFLNHFTHQVKDLRELRDEDDTSSYNDVWCKSTLDVALSTHSAMSSHVSSLATTRSALLLALGSSAPPDLSFDDYLLQLQDHATLLDSKDKTARQRRRANQSQQTQSTGGRGSARGGGRGGGRGGRGGQGRGGRGGAQSSTPTDVTDPSVWLSYAQYQALTPEQRRTRYERKQAAQRAANATTTTQPQSSAASVPPTIAVNAATSDQQSVAGSIVTTPPAQPTAPPAAQPGTVLHNMMSSSSARGTPSSTDSVTINGVTYTRQAQATHVYRVHEADTSVLDDGALVDGGANGGLIGTDARILETDLIATADVIGVTDNVLTSLPIVQAAAKIDTVNDGPIIGIFSSYAQRGDGGRTIHSKGQMESFGLIVDDKSRAVGGSQCIVTNEGYVIPLHVRGGLPYMSMSVPNDDDMDTFPHVFFCADSPWDPSILDNEFTNADFDTPDVATARRDAADSRVDAFGQTLTHNSTDVETHAAHVDSILATVRVLACTIFATVVAKLSAFPQHIRPNLPDLDSLRPHFGWVPVERIKQTLDATTQFYRATVHHPFRKHFKSRFPAANVRRLPEWFSTDTFFADVPALDDGLPGHGGCTMLQIYGGIDSHFLAGYPMSSESDVSQTMEDFIRQHGAMEGLMSDNAKSEISTAVKNLHRLYCIKDRQSEPHYQHQNPIERRIQDVKRLTNNIMDRVGCPAGYWLLCTLFVIGLLNHLVNANGAVPMTLVTGEVTDVSAYLTFHFWQEVFVEEPDKSERLGRWVGVAHDQGDKLTYLVLTHDTKQVVTRSNVRPAKDSMFPNRRERPANSLPDGGEESSRPVLNSVSDAMGVDPSMIELPKFAPEELLGLTFLRETDNGERIRAKVTRKILDRDAENHQNIKFLVSCGDDAYEEIIAYNELSDIIERQHQAEADGELDTWTFKDVVDHEGPLPSSSPKYKGSSYNVLVLWEDGSKTWEPLNMLAKDDPVTIANYAKQNDLLETPGWKFLRRIARRAKKLQRMLNQARHQSKHNAVRYKFGVRVPRNVKEAYDLDRANGNTLWEDSMKRELSQLFDYETFLDVGKDVPTPQGHKMIRARMIFDVKQTGQRKSRFVAGGHLTDPPKESVYSSVVSLRSIRIICFLAELNGLELMAADIGNAYLEAYTKEKVAFIAGPEFGPLAGHTLIIKKALYGLRSSGARFHEKCADTLRDLGFEPTYADPDVWIRDAGDVYEYVATWVDDLLVAMKNPKEFMDALQAEPYKYKLKGVEEPKYHLGGDFFRDSDGTLCYGAQTYIRRLVQDYSRLFDEEPSSYRSPLEKGDHPELDMSEPLGPDETAKFQSLIGALQWTISLCRFDIANAVMTLSRYRAAPQRGHLDRAKRVVGYLKKYPHACIRFRTGIPDHESMYGEQPPTYDWMYSVYGNPKEEIPSNAPIPKGKSVRTTTFKDANLMHDFTTGRSATGTLHLLNQTPIGWFAKRQGQVETATYGSEFVAARTAVEQIIDLRYTLRMFGVPLEGPSWLFGDNRSVVTSSTIPHSTLSKRWNALSYHRVREAVAAGYVRFHFIDSKQNPSDILTKPLDHATAWPHVDTLLFRKGDTKPREQPSRDLRGVTNSGQAAPARISGSSGPFEAPYGPLESSEP